jgi:ribosomal protein S6
VNIPKLGINSSTNGQELTLKFIPESGKEKKISLNSLTQLRLQTKPLNKDTATDWFWGNIEVKNVNFSEFVRTGKVTDEVKKSTILKGEIRLQGNKLELQEQQFLIVESPNPGIRKLRSLEINRESPAGLRTFFTGESRGISVGLYPEFPVQSLKPSWLAKHLSQEAVNGILALLGAFTGIFLPRLFPEKSPKP